MRSLVNRYQAICKCHISYALDNPSSQPLSPGWGCTARCRWGWCAACRQSRSTRAGWWPSSWPPAPGAQETVRVKQTGWQGRLAGGTGPEAQDKTKQAMQLQMLALLALVEQATASHHQLCRHPHSSAPHLVRGADHAEAGGDGQRLLAARHRHVHPPLVKLEVLQCAQEGGELWSRSEGCSASKSGHQLQVIHRCNFVQQSSQPQLPPASPGHSPARRWN